MTGNEPYSSLTPPEWPRNVGKTRTIKSIEGEDMRFTILDEIMHPETDFPQKLICFQQVEFEGRGISLRLGYYMLGWKESRRGKWVWGQFAPFITLEDLSAIIEEAQSRGWF